MKKPESTIKPSQDNQRYSWDFWVWLAAAMLSVVIFTVLFTAWAVRNIYLLDGTHLSPSQSRIVKAIAEFPSDVFSAFRDVEYSFGGDPITLLLDRKSTEQQQWVRRFPAPEDTGYLLLSGVDPSVKHYIVQLIRIADGTPVGRWDPDWPTIYAMTTSREPHPKGSIRAAHAVHPLLLANGDIIFNTESALVRLSSCSSKPAWVLDEIFNHSLELDENGNIWGSSVASDGYPESPWLQERIKDDALAHVTSEGVILEKRSFARILRDNGLEYLFMGLFGSNFNTDPIHLNEIKPAMQDSKYWKRGDLLISARHLSTLFLYRPSTNKIIWYKTGPWMNQHSVDFVDNHRISVFNNNVISGIPNKNAFITPNNINQVILYDFDTKQVTQPFAKLLAQSRPVSISEGVARVLPDGGLFIEETNNGRHLRFLKDHLLWSRVNDYDEQHIGLVSWSRYLTANEVRTPLLALASKQCLSTAPPSFSTPPHN